jgi:hypothetical protein
MARHDGKSDLIKAAVSRLQDAERLLEISSASQRKPKGEKSHTRGAMYLAGYAIECVLKVYIIQAQRANTLTEAVSKLRAVEQTRPNPRDIPDLNSTAGHRLSVLLGLTDLAKYVEQDTALRRDWNLSFQWQSTWRYDPHQPELEDAKEFVSAVRKVYNWIKAKI